MLEFLGSTTTEVMVNLFTAVAAVALIIWALIKGLQERYATAYETTTAYDTTQAPEREAGTYRPEYKIPSKKAEKKALPKEPEKPGRSIQEILHIFRSKELDELEAELKTKIYQILKEELKAESVGFGAEHQTILEQITEALMMQEAAIVIEASEKFRTGEKNRLAKEARIYTERAEKKYAEIDKIRGQCKGILEKIRKYMERVIGYDIERLSEKLAEIETEEESKGPEPHPGDASRLPPDVTYTPRKEEPGVKTVQATVRDKSAGPGGLPRAGEELQAGVDDLKEAERRTDQETPELQRIHRVIIRLGRSIERIMKKYEVISETAFRLSERIKKTVRDDQLTQANKKEITDQISKEIGDLKREADAEVKKDLEYVAGRLNTIKKAIERAIEKGMDEKTVQMWRDTIKRLDERLLDLAKEFGYKEVNE